MIPKSRRGFYKKKPTGYAGVESNLSHCTLVRRGFGENRRSSPKDAL